MSLVELMVAITIGLLLLAGISMLIAQQSQASAEINKTGQQIENGRYALQVLREDIELAGFYGYFYKVGAPAGFPNPCATTAADLQAAITMPVQGYNSPATLPAALAGCLNAANYLAGTDILVVRHAAGATTPLAGAVAGQPYLQSGINATKSTAAIIGTGSDTSVFNLLTRTGAAAPLRRFMVNIYFVSPCNVPATGSNCNGNTDDGGVSTPTLKKLELTVVGGATAFSLMPLVDGVQNVQFDYGIDNDGDGAPDYTTAGTNNNVGTPLTAADWAQVMTVRAHVLVRTLTRTGGHTDQKTYNLGLAGDVGPFNDNYKRHVFTELVRVVNPSGRKAS